MTRLPLLPASASPYRLLDEQGQQIEWANRFLDAKLLLQRSPRSLRAYAFDLLHFARWLVSLDPPRPLVELSEVLKLEQPDVDLGEGVLTIRQTKFGKTRLVPGQAIVFDGLSPRHSPATSIATRSRVGKPLCDNRPSLLPGIQ